MLLVGLFFHKSTIGVASQAIDLIADLAALSVIIVLCIRIYKPINYTAMFRKIIFTLLSGVFLFTSCAEPQKGAFTINGTIDGFDGKEIYFAYANRSTFKSIVDTAIISNGKFTFTGILDVEYCYGTISMGDMDYQNTNRFSFYMEPAEMTVVIPGEDFTKGTLEGSTINKESQALSSVLSPLYDKVNKIREQLASVTDEKERAELESLQEQLANEGDNAIKEFIVNNPDSYFAVEQLSYKAGRLKYDELKELYDGLSERVKSAYTAKEIEKELTALENTQPGAQAPEIAKNDINGNPFSLSSLKGKVVVLDFWASWCKPCRASNPHLLKVYEKYHDKGLEIVCVSDDDNAEDKWKKAIEDDGIGAFYHVLRGLKVTYSEDGSPVFDRSEDSSDLYAVHYIPTKFLIDREGKIVCKIESEEQLDQELEKLFN